LLAPNEVSIVRSGTNSLQPPNVAFFQSQMRMISRLYVEIGLVQEKQYISGSFGEPTINFASSVQGSVFVHRSQFQLFEAKQHLDHILTSS
jgi:hypothetical protein